MRRLASLMPISLCLLAACSFDEVGGPASPWSLHEQDQGGSLDAPADMRPGADISPSLDDMPSPPVDMPPEKDMPPRADMRPDLPTGELDMPTVEPDMPTMSCGDGLVDPGERCDGDCPATVTDCAPPPPEACARVRLDGSAARCDAQCVYFQQSACVDQDGCCPQGCTSNNDDDCSPRGPRCGDGVVDPGEQCDGSCPLDIAQCDDANACTHDSFVGAPQQCTAQCINAPITACQSGDGCCPQGCESADTDCTAHADLCLAPLPSPLPGGPSSVIDSLVLGTSATAGRDYDNDGIRDNALGDTLDSLSVFDDFTRDDYNAHIASRIGFGAIALVLEHRDITRLVGPQRYAMAWLHGSPRCFQTPAAAGENAYHVLSSSYDANGAPRSLWPAATLSAQRRIETSSTTLSFPIDLFGATLEVPLRDATLEATIDMARSGLPHTGVALEDGMLSGHITLRDLYASINATFRDTCSCASPPHVDLIRDTSTGHLCNTTVNTKGCGQGSACRALHDNCNRIALLLPQFADVSSQSPSSYCDTLMTCDSLSAGFTFTASGAVLVGTAP